MGPRRRLSSGALRGVPMGMFTPTPSTRSADASVMLGRSSAAERREHAARSHRRPRRRLRSERPGGGARRARDGRGVALAHDAIALMDALGIIRFAVVGHDWGARAAYTLAALYPDRIAAAAVLALAYQPGGCSPRRPSRSRASSGTSGSCASKEARRPSARTRRASPASCGTPGARRAGSTTPSSTRRRGASRIPIGPRSRAQHGSRDAG
jgi:pimeloyl-ACP methyl ester carboxylesterase